MPAVRRRLCSVLNGLLLALLFAAPGLARQRAATDISDVVAAIARGTDGPARRLAITTRLDAMNVTYELQAFTGLRGRTGTNVVATIPAASDKVLLIGAHYDRVAVGQGVLDNAGSCAVLLHLLRDVSRRPLRNFTLRVVFFDLEEGGVSGSAAFFEGLGRGGSPMPTFGVNLDIFGYGDTFYTAASDPTGPLLRAFQRAAEETGIAVRLEAPARYPVSDHRNMITAGVDTLGVALIDGKELDALTTARQAQVARPRVLTIIHTAADTMDVLVASDVEKGAVALDRFLRQLDATSSSAPTRGSASRR